MYSVIFSPIIKTDKKFGKYAIKDKYDDSDPATITHMNMKIMQKV